MKKLFYTALLFAGTLNINAQSDVTQTDGKNDIMLSPIELIAAPLLNVSYERLLNENSGLGINAMLGLSSSDNNVSQFSPYYRMYFGKKYAAGFFVEGFVPITTTKHRVYAYSGGPNDPGKMESQTTAGAGIGFGGKWVAKKNVIFEASFGIARRFGVKETNDFFDEANKITGKGMLGIGYRF